MILGVGVALLLWTQQLGRRLAQTGVRDVPDLLGLYEQLRRALEKVAEHNPDLILLDVAMPGLDGLETLDRILGIPNAPPVVFTDVRPLMRTSMPSYCSA